MNNAVLRGDKKCPHGHTARGKCDTCDREDDQAEIAQLRGELSLAEEGLANYAQENEGAKHDIERLMAACNEEANEVERLKAALERIKRIGYGLELHSDAEERAEYWSAMALEYRRIAAEALRPAEPQTCRIDPVSGNAYSAPNGKDESGTAPGAAGETREAGAKEV